MEKINSMNRIETSSIKRKRLSDDMDADSRKKMKAATEPVYNLVRCNATVGMENIQSSADNRKKMKATTEPVHSLVRCNATVGMNNIQSASSKKPLAERNSFQPERNIDSKWRKRTEPNGNIGESENVPRPLVRSHATVGLSEDETRSINHSVADVIESKPNQRPRMTLLGSMKKSYKKPLRSTRFITWTVTKMKAGSRSDSPVVEWTMEMNSAISNIRTEANELETRKVLANSHNARNKMSDEHRLKLHKAVQKWNQCFGTFYSII